MGRLEIRSVIERIEEIRKAQGISQLLLSEWSGISRSNLYYILTENVSPTLDSLDRIADALGVGMAEFFKPSKNYAAIQAEIAKKEKEFFTPDYPDAVEMYFIANPEIAEEYGVDIGRWKDWAEAHKNDENLLRLREGKKKKGKAKKP